jgi:hypothetical protein
MVRVLTTPNLDDLELDEVLAAALGVVERRRQPAVDNAQPETAGKTSASGAWG